MSAHRLSAYLNLLGAPGLNFRGVNWGATRWLTSARPYFMAHLCPRNSLKLRWELLS